MLLTRPTPSDIKRDEDVPPLRRDCAVVRRDGEGAEGGGEIGERIYGGDVGNKDVMRRKRREGSWRWERAEGLGGGRVDGRCRGVSREFGEA